MTQVMSNIQYMYTVYNHGNIACTIKILPSGYTYLHKEAIINKNGTWDHRYSLLIMYLDKCIELNIPILELHMK